MKTLGQEQYVTTPDVTTVEFEFSPPATIDKNSSAHKCDVLYENSVSATQTKANKPAAVFNSRHLRVYVKANGRTTQLTHCKATNLTKLDISLNFIYKVVVINQQDVTLEAQKLGPFSNAAPLGCETKVDSVEIAVRDASPDLASVSVYLLCNANRLAI